MKARVLLVDDNEDYLDSTKDVLEEEGYEVITASSGEEAVKMSKTASFDVVLMDIKMPGLNGVEAFIEMKKSNPSLKAVMCTAYIVESLIRKALEEGAYAVLNKPFEMDLLMRTIDNARQHTRNVLTVLIADRDKELCDQVSRQLARAGHKAVQANDGRAALKQAESLRFDLLLLEASLPIVDGLEVYRRIRTRQPHVMASIIMGATNAVNRELNRSIPREKGLTAVTKPLDINSLMELIQSISAAGNS